MPRNKGFVLASRPQGAASVSNFRFFEQETAEPGPGQVLVRNLWLSIDPYMRGRMDDTRSYAASQALNEVMIGGTAGEVIASNNEKFRVGDKVVSQNGGWQLYALSDGDMLSKVDASNVALQAFVGPLGVPGITAWVGINRLLQPKAGETVVVSAGTGAVGTVVGQLAKARRARAVGIAGGPDKCKFAVEELGYDACADHKAPDFAEQLKQATPNGIDGLFENVGGQPFALSMNRMNDFGRIAICGVIASYDGTEKTPVNDVRIILQRRLTMHGFIIFDFMSDWPQAQVELIGLAASGRLKWRETIAEGIENAPSALLDLLKGKNFGKQLVKLA